MEQKSNSLGFRHISQAAQEAVEIVHGRKNGTIQLLQTRWAKLNDSLMKGIEWNCIFTIGGISGSGKSSIADELETSLIDLNPHEDFVVLSFNWEMVSSRRVLRKISSKVNMSVKQLFSADNNVVTTDQFNTVVKAANQVYAYPIYYVDTPGTPQDVLDTFFTFRKQFPDKKKFVIFLDHTILTKGRQSQKQNDLLSELQSVFLYIKKYGAETGDYSSIIFQLSQLNREIETQDRIMSLEGQYPRRSDIFGGDAVYQTSDYVLITHCPEKLYIQQYGPQGLPTEGYLYWHIIKNRDGDLSILQMINNLKYNKVDESN
jgi:replicative DNA helicase